MEVYCDVVISYDSCDDLLRLRLIVVTKYKELSHGNCDGMLQCGYREQLVNDYSRTYRVHMMSRRRAE